MPPRDFAFWAKSLRGQLLKRKFFIKKVIYNVKNVSSNPKIFARMESAWVFKLGLLISFYVRESHKSGIQTSLGLHELGINVHR